MNYYFDLRKGTKNGPEDDEDKDFSEDDTNK